MGLAKIFVGHRWGHTAVCPHFHHVETFIILKNEQKVSSFWSGGSIEPKT
jgi:hypothetical protein